MTVHTEGGRFDIILNTQNYRRDIETEANTYNTYLEDPVTRRHPCCWSESVWKALQLRTTQDWAQLPETWPWPDYQVDATSSLQEPVRHITNRGLPVVITDTLKHYGCTFEHLHEIFHKQGLCHST